MDKKGQKLMLGLMLGIMLFIAAANLLPLFTDTVDDVRGTDHLNCTRTDLSTGQAATCVMVDWSTFYWFGSILAVIAAVITFKKT